MTARTNKDKIRITKEVVTHMKNLGARFVRLVPKQQQDAAAGYNHNNNVRYGGGTGGRRGLPELMPLVQQQRGKATTHSAWEPFDGGS
ncbi:hypothetical protein ACA910_003454 [Epithemia clementina (nom. ined.)]